MTKHTAAAVEPPAGISAEAQAQINEEEQVVQQVVLSLESQRSIGGKRLRNEAVRAQQLTSRIVAARRDVDKQLLASDEAVSHKLVDMKQSEIESIDKLIEKPYFARIILDEDDGAKRKSIEFRLGVAANSDCRIIDWRRAPISKLYYEYQEGEEYCEEILGRERTGRVILRNKVDIEHGELQRLTCRSGSFRKVKGSWIGSGGDVRARSAETYGRLPDVLSLITPDQFRTITEDAETAILIQGVAGSGKTTVALHRMAWLLHPDNSDIQSNETVVLVRSNALKTYIAGALPALGVEGVDVHSFHEWAATSLSWLLSTDGRAKHVIKRPVDRTPPSIKRVCRSMAFLKALELYAAGQRRRLCSYLDESIKWELLAPPLRKELDQFRESKEPPLPFLARLLNALKLAASTATDASAIADAEKVASTVDRRFRLYQRDLIAILAEPKRVLMHDETGLLDAELIAATKSYIERNLDQGLVSPAEDALLLRLGQLKRGAVFMKNGEMRRYRHIVVDEVQDFSAPELAAVIGAVEKLNQLTLVGDSGQAIGEAHTFPGWDKLRSYWSLGSSLSQFIALTVTHRSTLEIMKLGDHIQGEQRTTEGRKGKPPLWYKCRNEDQGVTEAIGWLTRVIERYPDGIVAVICRTPKEARYAHGLLTPTFGSAVRLGDDSSFSFQEGILVTDIAQVKGLEFPQVLVWNPSAADYGRDERSKNLLYVAVTRAEEHLCLISWGKPSPLLPPLHSGLVRGVDRDAELADEEAEESASAREQAREREGLIEYD